MAQLVTQQKEKPTVKTAATATPDILALLASGPDDTEISIEDLHKLIQQGKQHTTLNSLKTMSRRPKSAGGTPMGVQTPGGEETPAGDETPGDVMYSASDMDQDGSDVGEGGLELSGAGLEIVGVGYGAIPRAKAGWNDEPAEEEEIIEISMGHSHRDDDSQDDYSYYEDDDHDEGYDGEEGGADEDRKQDIKVTPKRRKSAQVDDRKEGTPKQTPSDTASTTEYDQTASPRETAEDKEPEKFDASEVGKLNRAMKKEEERIAKVQLALAEVTRARRQDVASIKEAFQELNSSLNKKLREVVEDNSELLARLNTVARTNIKLQDRLKKIGEKNDRVRQMLNQLREKRGLELEQASGIDNLTDMADVLSPLDEVTIGMIEQDYLTHKKMLVDLVNWGVYDGITLQRSQRKHPGGDSATEGGTDAEADADADGDDTEMDVDAGSGRDAVDGDEHEEVQEGPTSEEMGPETGAEAMQGMQMQGMPGAHPGMSASPENHSQTQEVSVDRLMQTLGLAGVAEREVSYDETSLQELMTRDLVELSKSFFGSRCVQSHLEANTPGFFQGFFEQAKDRIFELMTNKFGRFAFGMALPLFTEEQREIVLVNLIPKLSEAACDAHGSFGTQMLIKSLGQQSHLRMVAEALKKNVVNLICNHKGHYLAIVVISLFPFDYSKFIDEAIITDMMTIAVDNQGLQVIKALFQTRAPPQITPVMKAIAQHAMALVEDQYGNYVVQQCLVSEASAHLDATVPANPPENLKCFYDNRRCKQRIMKGMIGHFRRLSQQKFSSNVVERGLRDLKSAHWVAIIIDELLAEPQAAVRTLINDKFGNYVLQTALSVADQTQIHQLSSKITPHLNTFRSNLKIKWMKLLKQAKVSSKLAGFQEMPPVPLQHMSPMQGPLPPHMMQEPGLSPIMQAMQPGMHPMALSVPMNQSVMYNSGWGVMPPMVMQPDGQMGGVPPHLQHTYQLHHMPHPNAPQMMLPHPMYPLQQYPPQQFHPQQFHPHQFHPHQFHMHQHQHMHMRPHMHQQFMHPQHVQQMHVQQMHMPTNTVTLSPQMQPQQPPHMQQMEQDQQPLQGDPAKKGKRPPRKRAEVHTKE